MGWFVLRDEAVDGGLKVVDGSEDAALEALAREFGEEGLGIGRGCRSRREVGGPARRAPSIIDREHHRVLGRIDIEADNILELLGARQTCFCGVLLWDTIASS